MLNLEVIGEGTTTKIYRDGDKAIKLYINASYDEVESEANYQSFALRAGLPVPAVLGVRRLDEKMTALDMEYISGKPLFHERMDVDERRESIAVLVNLQCQIHAIDADSLPKQTDKLSWKIRHSEYINDLLKDRLISLLYSLDDGALKVCHGDFHPLNIIFDGRKHWIIDWVDATAGNSLADACRTYLIFKQFLSRSSGIYLSLFCKTTGASKEDVLAWLPVVTAARLSENMDDKTRTPLLKIIDKWIQSS